MGVSELEAAFIAVVGLEFVFLCWCFNRRGGRAANSLVDDAYRLGMRARR